MKTKMNIKKWTEPLIYVILVAAFGFLTTVVTHTRSEKPVEENDLVSFTIENEMAAKEVSL